MPFRDAHAARAGGYVLVFATILGLTTLAVVEVIERPLDLPRWAAWTGLGSAVLSWGRGVGSATGLYFLEPLIFANIPAFLWLGYVGARVARAASVETPGERNAEH